MQTATSFPAAAVQRDQLNDILTNYLALDRARTFRRLLVTRFGALAALALVAGAMVGDDSAPLICAFAVAVCVSPRTWAWIAERRLASRLAQQLSDVAPANE